MEEAAGKLHSKNDIVRHLLSVSNYVYKITLIRINLSNNWVDFESRLQRNNQSEITKLHKNERNITKNRWLNF